MADGDNAAARDAAKKELKDLIKETLTEFKADLEKTRTDPPAGAKKNKGFFEEFFGIGD